jgi:hypothetical protein
MKLKIILSAALFGAVSSLSLGVYAADMEKAPAAEAQAKKMKPHSHMEEKTGIAPKAPEAASEEKKSDKADKYRADKDKSRHLHPRDGK